MHDVNYAESFWIYHDVERNELRTQDMALIKTLEKCKVTGPIPSWFEE